MDGKWHAILMAWHLLREAPARATHVKMPKTETSKYLCNDTVIIYNPVNTVCIRFKIVSLLSRYI
jgi:hypothetical protein